MHLSIQRYPKRDLKNVKVISYLGMAGLQVTFGFFIC